MIFLAGRAVVLITFTHHASPGTDAALQNVVLGGVSECRLSTPSEVDGMLGAHQHSFEQQSCQCTASATSACRACTLASTASRAQKLTRTHGP